LIIQEQQQVQQQQVQQHQSSGVGVNRYCREAQGAGAIGLRGCRAAVAKIARPPPLGDQSEGGPKFRRRPILKYFQSAKYGSATWPLLERAAAAV
jgi:hypothetical protein